MVVVLSVCFSNGSSVGKQYLPLALLSGVWMCSLCVCLTEGSDGSSASIPQEVSFDLLIFSDLL